ncbi:low-specificity L-threonine aldolase [Natronospira sp. AB-CW4]|uniref:Low-specificity L-threonine aldolase n=1 Tax=Natronospira bacteriovora TaxID=3069753 RepID=A0ABU0W8E9_9GAMM|nr:low-specificity L-threonine aldolase [Natronospira sp. AB-CW4]MDQ2070232.1 low-specificity L-threonine aldolase [Natronospira sp. AB-CW4]
MIDLRSDTVTRPTAAMRDAMMAAEVGDDVYGEDPTVNRLEALAAERLGLEAGLFLPSGTQSNLAGLLAHCQRGDEYIVGHNAHTYQYEGGGAAVLGGIQPQPLPLDDRGCMDPAAVVAAIKPDDAHFARTRLLCLENTWWGRPLPMDYLDRMQALARDHGLAFHLDGARVFNAAVSHGVPVADITARFDSVSFCLSKGLGAPVGSVLCGSTSLIHEARRWRKVLGGGMRQAGILAAAGIHALEHHVDRLADDHRRAAWLADELEATGKLAVDRSGSNILMVRPSGMAGEALAARLQDQGVRVNPGPTLRLVTHLDIDDAAIEQTVAAFGKSLAA